MLELLGSDSEDCKSVVSADSFGEPHDRSVGIMQRRVTAVCYTSIFIHIKIVALWHCTFFILCVVWVTAKGCTGAHLKPFNTQDLIAG